jgi:hypothetical protein
MKTSKEILQKARKEAGWRERYAMENCKTPRFVANGDSTLLIFNYSEELPYQDGNGATFDTLRLAWVN